MPIQENLPEDFPSPNSINDKYTPIVTRAGEPYNDPTGALPPGTEKYTITSNQWLAILLQAGKFSVRGREEGQTIYISQTPDATTSLRITKAFDIETQNRTALYIKGQSIIDQIIKNLEQQIAGKADAVDVYTKPETDLKIQVEIDAALAHLTNVMQFKGVIPSQNDLPTVDVSNGDVYQALDSGKFYVAKIEADGSIVWEELSGTFVDLADYYNKAETDLLLEGKADKTDLNKYKALVENFIPTFTWQQNSDPSLDNRPTPIEVADLNALNQVGVNILALGTIYQTLDDNLYYKVVESPYTTVPDLPDIANATLNRVVRFNNSWYQCQELNGNLEWVEIQTLPKIWTVTDYDPNWTDPTKEWDTWLQPETGLIFVRKVSQIDGNLFWLNSLESGLLIAGRNYVTTNTQQNITAVKTFTVLPETDTNIAPTKDNQFVTKKYVDENGGGGQPIIPTNVARLDTAQTFTEQNTFQVAPDVGLPAATVDNVNVNTLITKGQSETLVQRAFNTNPTIVDPITWDNLQDNQLVTKGILQGQGGTVDTTNLAKLDEENTFIKMNTFNENISLSKDPVSGNDAVRLSFMTQSISDEITKNNANYYDTTTIDTKLQDYVKEDSLAAFMEFKGTLTTYTELENITQKEVGDTYYVESPEDKKGFWSYDGTSFKNTGTGVSINDIDYAKLSYGNTNNYYSDNHFHLSYRDPNDPNAPEFNTGFSVGDWLSVTKNGISLNGKYLFNDTRALFQSPKFEIKDIAIFETTGISFISNPEITNTLPDNQLKPNSLITQSYLTSAGFAKLLEDNTFEGTNLFQLGQTESFTLLGNGGNTLFDANKDNVQLSVPLLQTVAQVKANMQDGEYITKKYLEDELANYTPGGGGTSFDFAADHTYTGDNTFNGKLESGTTATSIDDLGDKEVPTKKLVVEKVESLRIVSQDEPNMDCPAGTLWIKTSYEQSPNNVTNFTNKPGLFISLGNREWWDIHKEELL